MDNLSAAEIAEQKEILVQNGTLCLKCGSLNEDLVREDGSRVLKEAPGKATVCDKCKGMDTGYGFAVSTGSGMKVRFTSPLEAGFIPVEDEE